MHVMIGMGLIGLLLIGGAVAVVVALGLTMANRQAGVLHPEPAHTQGGAHHILAERLARGEISREEYDAIRKTIEA